MKMNWIKEKNDRSWFCDICRDRGGGGAGRAIALPLFCLG